MTPADRHAQFGVVQFHASVRIDAGAFARWTPEQVAAFFAGLAKVLAVQEASPRR